MFYGNYYPKDDTKEEKNPELVRYARSQLIDYYGSATPFFPTAQADVMHVERMSSDEVLREARHKNLI